MGGGGGAEAEAVGAVAPRSGDHRGRASEVACATDESSSFSPTNPIPTPRPSTIRLARYLAALAFPLFPCIISAAPFSPYASSLPSYPFLHVPTLLLLARSTIPLYP